MTSLRIGTVGDIKVSSQRLLSVSLKPTGKTAKRQKKKKGKNPKSPGKIIKKILNKKSGFQ